MTDEFRSYYDEAVGKARELCLGVKDAGYNRGGVQIRDYWKYHGPSGIAYEMHKKSLRAISISSPLNPEGAKLDESMLDTALDMINYAAFLYAEVKCRQEESNGNSTT